MNSADRFEEGSDPLLRRVRTFVTLFSVLYIINVGASEYLALEVFRASRPYWVRGAALQPGETERLDRDVVGPGGILLCVNAPAFVAVGSGLRKDPPRLGAGYYVTMVLGATYAPLLVALIIFLGIHPPGRWNAEAARGRLRDDGE